MNSSSRVHSSGLALIKDYSSEDDNSSDENNLKSPERLSVTERQNRLPLPSLLLNSSEEYVDDVSLHDGRIRTFPHERGNWATYIFIPFPETGLYQSFVDLIIANSDQSLELQAVQNPHISITRTVVLLHHWIVSFIETVEQRLNNTPSFDITFGSLSVYTNEEKTRTFIGMDVEFGSQELSSIVNVLNGCLKEFNLKTFYEEPSFHISFAWCLGDRKASIESSLPNLENCFQQFLFTHSEFRHLHVSSCYCKSGNKYFHLRLKSL